MLCAGWLGWLRTPRPVRGNLWGYLVLGYRNGSQAAIIPWAWGPASRVVVTQSGPPQDIITALEERLKPLVQAELSVLVDVLHWPELLFLEGSEAHQRCESGGFLSK